MIDIVKFTEIHTSIVRRIKTKFPDTVFSTDIEKAITRPSFYINFDNLRNTDFMRQAQDKEITVRIYYFSTTKDDNKVELLEMQDDLLELFLENNLIEVNDQMKYEIDEVELDIIDGVLHCYFDIRITQDYTRIDDTPAMEELEIDNL